MPIPSEFDPAALHYVFNGYFGNKDTDFQAKEDGGGFNLVEFALHKILI